MYRIETAPGWTVVDPSDRDPRIVCYDEELVIKVVNTDNTVEAKLRRRSTYLRPIVVEEDRAIVYTEVDMGQIKVHVDADHPDFMMHYETARAQMPISVQGVSVPGNETTFDWPVIRGYHPVLVAFDSEQSCLIAHLHPRRIGEMKSKIARLFVKTGDFHLVDMEVADTTWGVEQCLVYCRDQAAVLYKGLLKSHGVHLVDFEGKTILSALPDVPEIDINSAAVVGVNEVMIGGVELLRLDLKTGSVVGRYGPACNPTHDPRNGGVWVHLDSKTVGYLSDVIRPVFSLVGDGWECNRNAVPWQAPVVSRSGSLILAKFAAHRKAVDVVYIKEQEEYAKRMPNRWWDGNEHIAVGLVADVDTKECWVLPRCFERAGWVQRTDSCITLPNGSPVK